jgi:prepilin-type N-terminal cleavage/methylation domain-containing protein
MSRAASRGFTLIEIMIAFLILGMMMSFVYEIMNNAVRSRNAITEGLEGPRIENAVLDEIIRDLRFVYYRPGQFPADAGFWGRDRQVSGKDGDRIDFLTCRASRTAELEEAQEQRQVNAPLVEVGYACRPNDENNEWIEIWRRERYFVDDDPTDGGRYDLVYDKVRRFDLRYYPPPEERSEGDNGLEEWDTKVQHKLPYAIVVTLQFDVREPISKDQPQAKVRRIVLLTPARSVPPDAAMTGTPAGMTGM